MSFDVTALPAYIEQEDFDIMLKAQTDGRTAQLIDSQVGVKDSSAMHYMTTSVTLQADACGLPTATDSTAFTNKTVTVAPIALHENLCTKDLNGFWLQTKVAKGQAGEETVPGEIESLYVLDKMKTLSNVLETADWQGDVLSGTNNLSYYDGLLKNIDAGSPISANAGGITVATGITVANVISILQEQYLAIPENILNETDVTIFVGQDVYRLYQMALVNANLFNFVSNEDTMSTKLYGTNVAIEGVNGLNASNRIITGRASNFLIVMDGDADEDSYELWYSREYKVNKFESSFKRGTAVRFDDEVVEFTLVP